MPTRNANIAADAFVAALGRKARRRAIGRAGIHLDVPKIGNLGEKLDHFMRFRRCIDTRLASQFFQTDPYGHGAPVADRIARDFEQLTHQPHAVLDGAAVGVGTMIVFG
jgi:hypothetical protein